MNVAVIEADQAQRGGHALIRISGGAAKGLADPRFRLSRDGYENGTLGDGGWQVADALLTPLAARAENTDLVLSVGPAVVDLVESGTVMLSVPAAGFDEVVFWPEMPLSRGGPSSAVVGVSTAADGGTQITPIERPVEVQAGADVVFPPIPPVGPSVVPTRVLTSSSPDKPAAAILLPTPADATTKINIDERPVEIRVGADIPLPSEPLVTPRVMPSRALTGSPPNQPSAVVPDRRRSLLPLALGATLLIAAAGGGAWWAVHRSEHAATPMLSPPPTPAPVPPPTPGPSPAAAPLPSPAPATAPAVTPSQPATRDCSQGSVGDIVACAPDADALYAAAQRRWDAGQHDQGLVLMQIAADRGSGAAALRLAQLYDPNGFQPGGAIARPNARLAAQYYRRAAQSNQTAAAGPRQALRQWLQGEADKGDMLSALTLKDFWP